MLSALIRSVGAQLLLYELVPAWALARRPWRDGAEWLFASMVAGLATAAGVGWAANNTGAGVGPALGVWLAGWLVAGLWLRRSAPPRSLPPLTLGLVLILALAFAVRWIHPWQTWALGQSDAYSHLGFLINVLQKGRVANPDYPPAYAWVLAFPTWLVSLNPYWMARFGGAFFGAGLVLGIHALTSSWSGPRAGWVAAALAAGCPVFFLLQKTGVGCFANQLGLLLILAALWAFVGRRWFWLALALAALAVSVPMMLLHLLLLLTLWSVAVCRCARERLGLLMLLAAVAAVGTLLWIRQVPPERGRIIASLLTGNYAFAQEWDASWNQILRVLLTDFVSPKRWGYGVLWLNAAALAITGMFVAALAGGIRRQIEYWKLWGLWGLLTSLNLHLGVFQFTDYQREGWSFLMALACGCGLIFETVWSRTHSLFARRLLAGAVGLATASGLVFPPVHIPLQGPAESDLVRYVLNLDPTTTVLVRRTSSFPGGQGDVVRTLHPKTIHTAEELPADRRPVVFLRDYPPADLTLPMAMRRLQPRQMETLRKFFRHAEEDNRRLEAALAGRLQYRRRISKHLEVWQVEAVE